MMDHGLSQVYGDGSSMCWWIYLQQAWAGSVGLGPIDNGRLVHASSEERDERASLMNTLPLVTHCLEELSSSHMIADGTEE